MKLIAHSRRWSNVAASPDVTSGELPSRQRGDRPCAGLRWPRTANRASGRSLLVPSELFEPRRARAATGADDDPSSRSRPAHSDAQPFPSQSRARLPRYAHARKRACTSLGLLQVGIRQEHPRLEARRPRSFGRQELRLEESGSGSRAPDTVRVETRAVTQHRTGDVEQAVSHRAQGAGVAVAAGAERLILVVADRIALGGDARPVAGSVAQSVVGGQTARDEQALARTPSDRSHSAETAKCVVVPVSTPW